MTRSFLPALYLIFLSFLLFGVGIANAAVFTVNTFADLTDANPGNGVCDNGGFCALRAAIMEANALPGIDTIILNAGTFRLTIGGTSEDLCATGDLDVRSDIVILGLNARSVFIDADSIDRVFHVLIGSLKLYRAEVREGRVQSNNGGAFYVAPSTALTLEDVSILNSSAGGANGNKSGGGFGGAIYADNASVTLNKVTLASNAAIGGNGQNGVQPGGGAGGGGAPSLGGALCARNSSTVTITNCTFSANRAIGGLGGNGTWHSSSGTTASNGGNGGGLGGNGGAASGGVGTAGGFGGGGGGGASVTGAGGAGGFGGGGGGGGASSWGGNAGTGGGAGLYGGKGGQECCSAGSGGGGGAALGGAIFGDNSTINIYSSTIAFNSAAGGLEGQDFWGGRSGDPGQGLGGGIFNYNGSTININNTIIGRNGGSTTNHDLFGSFTSTNGHNFIEFIGTATIGGSTTGNVTNIDPRLDSNLLNNGGQTNTHGLLPCGPASPAVNVGTATGAPTLDQRDSARFGIVDIGAFELNYNPTQFDTVYETTCGGGGYFFGGQNRTVSGQYRDTLVSSQGCDSMVLLDLTISPVNPDTLTESICYGQSFSVGTSSYSSSGSYIDTLISTASCDSIIVLYLSVYSEKRDTISATVCDGDSFYHLSAKYYTTAGYHSDTIFGGGLNSCDSIVVLNLSIQLRDTVNAGLDDSLCAPASIPLNANLPVYGSGIWQIVNSIGTIANSTQASTSVNGFGSGINSFRWLIQNGVCPDIADTVIYTIDLQATAANAGLNISICDTSTLLQANAAGVGNSGTWTVISGSPNLANASSPTSAISLPSFGTSILEWKIQTSTSICPESKDSVEVTFNQSPTAAIAANSVCIGDTTTFTNTSVYTSGPTFYIDYQNNGSNDYVGSDTTTYYKYPSASNYTVKLIVVDGNTCSDTVTSTAVVHSLPSAVFNGDTACMGSNAAVNLSSVSAGVNQFRWIVGTDTTTSASSSFSYAFNNPGYQTVSVRLTDNNNCQFELSGTVLVSDTPVINVASVLPGCATSRVNVGVSQGRAPYNFNWSDAQTSPYNWIGNTVNPLGLTVTDQLGCLSLVDIPILATSINLNNASTNDVSCFGFSDGQITLSANGGFGDISYNWSNASNSSTVTGLVAGTYAVTITDESGCIYTDSFVISQPNALEMTFYPDSAHIFLGQSVDIQASTTGGSGAHSISWSPANQVDFPNAFNITATPIENMYFWATLVDAQNCTLQLYVPITVDVPEILIPTAFSPNGDGTNDFFKLAYYPASEINRFDVLVYNRWGQIVFQHSGDGEFEWDGIFNQIYQPIGTYAYRINVYYNNGETKHLFGMTTLLR